MREGADSRGGSGGGLAPLYERLPRGPHQLKRDEVVENQRRRMYGGMIESVALNGYGRTSVRHVVALAGVSRRAFYEQFANKEACFLATLDLIAGRARDGIAEAYRCRDGGATQRVGAALQALARMAGANPKSAHLLLVDAPSAGPAGWERLTETLSELENMLADTLDLPGEAIAMPDAVVKGIVGGLWRAMFVRLRERRDQELVELADDMTNWTLTFHRTDLRPAGSMSTDVPSAAPSARVRRGGRTLERHLDHAGETRAQVLEKALELAHSESYAELSPLRIADEAKVSIDVFFELFDDLEACMLAAIEHIGTRMDEAMAEPASESERRLTNGRLGQRCPEPANRDAGQWPGTVRETLAALTRHLSQHPIHAHTLTVGVFAMGERAIDLSLEVTADVARRLTRDAPGPPSSPLALECVAGAIWYTICRQAAAGTIAKLPTLADELALVVLAPFLGWDVGGTVDEALSRG